VFLSNQKTIDSYIITAIIRTKTMLDSIQHYLEAHFDKKKKKYYFLGTFVK